MHILTLLLTAYLRNSANWASIDSTCLSSTSVDLRAYRKYWFMLSSYRLLFGLCKILYYLGLADRIHKANIRQNQYSRQVCGLWSFRERSERDSTIPLGFCDLCDQSVQKSWKFAKQLCLGASVWQHSDLFYHQILINQQNHQNCMNTTLQMVPAVAQIKSGIPPVLGSRLRRESLPHAYLYFGVRPPDADKNSIL